LDLRQIKYFMLIYEHRSFSAAARKANVAQPALSMQIRHLEEELGVTLFERTSGGIVPTDLGRKFYELCTPVRDGVDFAKQQISALAASNNLFGSLKCGFPPSFFKRFLGRTIADFAERYPDVEFSVMEGYGGTLKEWVRSGVLEFAVGAWDESDTSLQAAQILEEDLVLVSGAPIFGERFSKIDLRKFEGYKLMLPMGHQVLGPILHQYLSNGIIRPSRTMVVDSYLGVLETARASDWAALIPITGILDEVAKGDLYIYPLVEPSLSFRWFLIHERGKLLSPAARAFIDQVSAEMANTPQAWDELLTSA
jgi:LysR family transcriptional regulator, nitrogen assimilation regulatory protein